MSMADCTLLLPRRTRPSSTGLGVLALLAAGVCSAASTSPGVSKVTAVRFWSLGEVTRVAIEVSADFKYRSDRLPDPARPAGRVHRLPAFESGPFDDRAAAERQACASFD